MSCKNHCDEKEENHVEEFIWVDGGRSPAVRSKFRVRKGLVENVREIPHWGFDGSSTMQAETGDSDRDLAPVRFYPDPIRGGNNILVLAEVNGPGRKTHPSNARAVLRDSSFIWQSEEPWFGFEQEYVFIDRKTGRPLGWEEGEFPKQGEQYCGENFGQDIVDEHLAACLRAGIVIFGGNSEVMLGQWEFQIGTADPLKVCDDLWVARWLLKRIADRHDVKISYVPKLFPGLDLNGSGCHTNYSTKRMREPNGLSYIEEAAERLGARHREHIAVYGFGNEHRLTGRHETASISEFKWGVGDRGASVRVNAKVAEEKCGYLEDRRPAANIDPYKIATAILDTTCPLIFPKGFDPATYGWKPDVVLE